MQPRLDLQTGSLMRVMLVYAGEHQAGWVLTIAHHLLVDTVSWSIWRSELCQAYEQACTGAQVHVAEVATSSLDWAQYLHQPSCAAWQQQWGFWQQVVAGSPSQRWSPQELAWQQSRRLSRHLEEEPTRQLTRQVTRRTRSQVIELLLCGILLSWQRGRQQEEVLLDIEGHGREEELLEGADLSRTMGWFTTLFPLRLSATRGSTLAQKLQAVKANWRQVPEHGIGYGMLRYGATQDQRSQQAEIEATPELCVNYLGNVGEQIGQEGEWQVEEEDLGPLQSLRGQRAHALELQVWIEQGRLQMEWTYSHLVHRDRDIAELAEGLTQALLEFLILLQDDLTHTYIPQDFPLLNLSQAKLDQILYNASHVEDMYPLSPMQQGMLFHTLSEPQAHEYFTQASYMVQRNLQVEIFRQAWSQVVQRHSILRTSFLWHGLEEPLQIVHQWVEVPLQYLDWQDLSEQEWQARLQHFLHQDLQHPFDFSEAPLLRLTLMQLSAGQALLVWSHHHILLDGWSLPIVLGDVLSCYEALCCLHSPSLPPAPSYRTYISWLRQQDQEKTAVFWRETLRGFSCPTPLPGAQENRLEEAQEKGYARRELVLSAELSAAILRLAHELQITINTVLQGAWALLLSSYSSQEDIVFGVTVSGRSEELPDVERLVGVLINSLPLRVRIDAISALSSWLKALQQQNITLRQYEYSSLVDIQGWSEVPRGQQLFESLFVFENYPSMQTGGLAEQCLQLDFISAQERASYPLIMKAQPGSRIPLELIYECRYYSDEVVERLLGHLHALLEAMVSHPEYALARLPLLGEAERHLILHTWNATQMDVPHDTCFHELFSEQAQRYPDAIALTFEQEHLSYQALEQQANHLAYRLQASGVGPERLVGICVQRSAHMVIGLLAILKAGGAYVPLDPHYPPERLAWMIQNAQLAALMTQPHLLEQLPPSIMPLFMLEDSIMQSEPQTLLVPPSSGVQASNLAYVIYTSGSTGQPKGVMLSHRGLVNLSLLMKHTFALGPQQRVLQFASLSFDASIWEVVMALSTGATLCLAPQEQLVPGPGLLHLLVEQQISTVTLPPSILSMLSATELPRLDKLISAGEPCPVPVVAIWSKGRSFFNAYGPTEITVCASLAQCRQEEPPSIGTPIVNMQLYILDFHGRPTPPGVSGELYLGGIGVARGYLGRPDLTAERFVPDPFSVQAGARLYRTGDRACFRADGQVQFLGRLDQQIKLRGLRIEPGEIEAIALQYPGIEECLVVIHALTSNDQRLVLYLRARGQFSSGALRGFLQQRLPDYMVPSFFVPLEQWPLSPNGKIDRHALPLPDETRSDFADSYVAPRTQSEEAIACIWQQLLKVDVVGVDDNFFDLGGHSLLAMQVVSQVVEVFQVEVSLGDFLRDGTVAALAARVEALVMEEIKQL
jgi:amino acid adenylation domain-containing protein/non-ribosomal peptide synthase protein (TIGR01720 family)